MRSSSIVSCVLCLFIMSAVVFCCGASVPDGPVAPVAVAGVVADDVAPVAAPVVYDAGVTYCENCQVSRPMVVHSVRNRVRNVGNRLFNRGGSHGTALVSNGSTGGVLYGSTGSVVTQSVVTDVVTYGSTGTAVATYGSTGSRQLFSRTPVRSTLRNVRDRICDRCN